MRERFLRAYARWMIHHAGAVVIAAFFLTALSLTVSILFLKTETGILDLYSKDTPVIQRFISYTNKFGAAENLIIVFEGANEGRRRAAMEDLAVRLKRDPHHYIQDFFYKVDVDLFKKHAFQFLSEDEATKMLQEAKSSDGGIHALFESHSFNDFLNFINTSIEQGLHKRPSLTTGQEKQFSKLIQPLLILRDYLGGEELSGEAMTNRLEESPEERRTIDDEGYLRTDDKQMHVMFIRPVDRRQDYKIAQHLVRYVRGEIAGVSPQYPDLTIGVTGGPALNNDQFEISEKDMTLASIFAFSSTAILFILAFKSFARPFFGLLTLALAMTWVFGLTTVMIGHLNIFSMAFIVILVGQGTYYGVHVVARYEEELHKGLKVPQAIEETLAHVSGNIIISAITTAAAFLATTLVKLKGFAELGWIAGMGVLICATTMLFVLPAFLVLWDRNRSQLFKPEKAPSLAQKERQARQIAWATRFTQRHAVLLLVIITSFAGWGAYLFYSPQHGIAFDNNLLNLQAKNTEAVKYEKKLIHTSLSPRAGIFMTSTLEEARRIADAVVKLATVQRVEWLGGVFPEGTVTSTTRQELRHTILDLTPSPLNPPDITTFKKELKRLQDNLEKIQNLALGFSQGGKILDQTETGISAIEDILNKFPDEKLEAKSKEVVETRYLQPQLSEFQKRFFGAIQGMLVAAAQAKPLQLVDLPKYILNQLLSSDGTYAIYAFPKEDIWERAPLEAFVQDLRKISPEVTGPPIMFFEVLNLIRSNYFKAAYLSALAIFIIFLIDFRSLFYAGLASLPLVLGVYSLFGLMVAFKLPFNSANMIALPMILGIGAGNGVHMIYRFREENAEDISFLFKSTGLALLITYLDSVTSFIGLAFANHQGLAQLGKVAILGLTTCTFAGFLSIPSVMALILKQNRHSAIP
jgi:uncharacterized protein